MARDKGLSRRWSVSLDEEKAAMERYRAGLNLSFRQAQIVTGINRRLFYKLGDAGPAFLRIGRQRIYRAEDVRAWLDERVRLSVSSPLEIFDT